MPNAIEIRRQLNIKLLQESIEHWERLANGTAAETETHFGISCPLCREYILTHPPEAACQGCPVFKFTGRPECKQTPWVDANGAWEEAGQDYNTPQFQEAAATMVRFLKAVLEDTQQT